MRDKKKKTIKVRDLKPTKDAKGGETNFANAPRAAGNTRIQGNTRNR